MFVVWFLLVSIDEYDIILNPLLPFVGGFCVWQSVRVAVLQNFHTDKQHHPRADDASFSTVRALFENDISRKSSKK